LKPKQTKKKRADLVRMLWADVNGCIHLVSFSYFTIVTKFMVDPTIKCPSYAH